MFGGHIELEEKPAEALKREFTGEWEINPTCFNLFDIIEHYEVGMGKLFCTCYFSK